GRKVNKCRSVYSHKYGTKRYYYGIKHHPQISSAVLTRANSIHGLYDLTTRRQREHFDIINDSEFSKPNQVCEAAVVELKRQGFGRVDHHRPISKEDLEKNQSCYNPSSPDPKSLQEVAWFTALFTNMRILKENLRLLTKQTFAMQVDATGKKYVYQALIDELDKNHRGKDQPDDSPGEGRMYERPKSPYC
ncbi:unnamed protein product, partial [Porites lobata]